MQLNRMPSNARDAALQTMVGEIGCASLFAILLATGAGLLLDFQITNLHPVFSVGLLLLSVPASMFWALRRTLSMEQKGTPNTTYVRNLALASVAGQAGCGSVVIIFLGLFAGLFLDSTLNTHPVFTIGLVLLAVPLSLYAMIRLMLSSVAAMRLSPPDAPREHSSATSVETVFTKENGS